MIGVSSSAASQLAEGLVKVFPLGAVADGFAREVGGVARALLGIERRLAHLGDATRVLPSLEHEIKRIAAAVESVPALRADMESLPPTIVALEGRMAELLAAIELLLGSVEELGKTTGTLAQVVHPLHGAAASLEALGERLHTRDRQPRRFLRGASENT